MPHWQTNRVLGVSLKRQLIGVLLLIPVLWLLMLIQDNRFGYFVITSESMTPALLIYDRLIKYDNGKYHQGDIVVFPDPKGKDALMVKRLIAVSPDTVELRAGLLFVNGQRSDPPSGQAEPLDEAADQFWQLSDGECFVAGDNRVRSMDSRDYGPIPIKQLQGRIFYRWKPKDRRGWIR